MPGLVPGIHVFKRAWHERRGWPGLVVRFQHSHPISASTFANVGIKGPPANIDASGALDLTFAF
jgi:hypothetical protein